MHDIIKRVYTSKMENWFYIKHIYKTNPGPFACFKKFLNLVRLFGISLYKWNSWKMSKFQSSNFKRRIYTNHSTWSIKREKILMLYQTFCCVYILQWWTNFVEKRNKNRIRRRMHKLKWSITSFNNVANNDEARHYIIS